MNGQLKASFYTLGCRLNQAETGIISNSFRERGYQVVDFNEPADVCVINSCTVTEQADAKCRQIVRHILRKNPDTFVAVVGCYAQTGNEMLQQMAGIDLIVGTQDKMHVVDFIDKPLKRQTPQIIRTKISRSSFTMPVLAGDLPTTRANLKIQDGCDFMCSFCIIPFARGRARSRAFGDIRQEAIRLVDSGYKELILTGVNIGTYSYDDKTFLDVVKMLLPIPGLERLRISSIEPTTIPVELLDLMADSEKMCSHLHIPLQSGSNKILQAMKRLYTLQDFLDFLELASQKIPEILIGTDIMVGFPGESDADFAESCKILESSPLAYAHVFTYSERQGTSSARIQEKVPAKIKKRRSKVIHRLSENKKNDFYQSFMGRTVRMLTEQKDVKGRWLGFSDNYLKIALCEPDLAENELVDVKITEVHNGLAIGQIQNLS